MSMLAPSLHKGRRLRILVVAELPHLPLTGAGIRITRLAEGLAERHEVEIVFIDRGARSPVPKMACRTRVVSAKTASAPATMPPAPLRRLVRVLEGRSPLHSRYDPGCSEAVCRMAAPGKYDIVQFESSSLAPYVTHLRHRIPRAFVVLDCYDIEWLIRAQEARREVGLWSRAKGFIRALNVARAERGAFACSALTFLVNERELALARWMAPFARFALLPNGADFAAGAPRRDSETKGRVLFVGSMNYAPNADGILWFVREVWPTVRRLCPETSLDIVGRNPARDVLDLSGAQGIHVTGAVESIRPYLDAAQIAVVPLRMGTGTRLKILEALAAGKAVVSTKIGAAGLNLIPGRHIALANSPAEFASATLRLLADSRLRAALGAAGRAYASRKYNWRAIVEKAETAYEGFG